MQSIIPFSERIADARKWERAISRWLTEERGYPVVNLFEWPEEYHEGPRLYLPFNQKVALGDIFIPRVQPQKKLHGFLDIKARKGFCWSDKESDWQVSLSVKQYKDYLAARKQLDDDFWIFFFLQYARPSQQDSKKKGCPKECPTGLFAIEILDIEKLGKDKTHIFAEDKYISKSSPGFHLLASYEAIARYLEDAPRTREDEMFEI